jgi:2'-5' RNA ligase
MRTFLGIPVPDQIKRKINDLVSEEKKRRLPVKWVRCENLHITLRFLGEIDEMQKENVVSTLNRIRNKYDSFEMNLEHLGCFPHPSRPRVLWIGVGQGGDILNAIAGQIEDDLGEKGFKREGRFHAHLTIGRVKKPCNVDALLMKPFCSENMLVHSINLYESLLKPEGPVYRVLHSFSLVPA